MVASTDGYCTLVQFSSSELGVPLPPEKQKVKVTQKGDVEPEETPKSKKNPNKGKNANKDAAKEEEKVSSNLLWELYPKKSALVMRGECVELSIKCVSIGSGQEHSVCARVLCVCVCVCVRVQTTPSMRQVGWVTRMLFNKMSPTTAECMFEQKTNFAGCRSGHS